MTKQEPRGLWGWIRAHWFWHPRVDTLDKWISAFAVLAPFTSLPQLFSVYVERRADLSLPSWTMYVLFNIPFLLHGVLRKDYVVLFSASLNMCLQGLIVVGILLYH